MKLNFSDRIGVTSPNTVLQLDGMSDSLRNKLWNCILRYFYEDKHGPYYKFTADLCDRFFKLCTDDLPHPYRDARLYYKDWFKKIFFSQNFKWHENYNLIEFIVQNADEWIRFSSDDLRKEISSILEEEMSGYRFVAGILTPISNSTEMNAIEEAINKAHNDRSFGTQKHIKTAVECIAKRPNPDYRNSVKESISAVEALAKKITGIKSGGLKNALDAMDAKIGFHPAFKEALLKLYGYTSDKDGIRHAIIDGPNITFDDAKFMLVICSALVNYLIPKIDKFNGVKP